MSINWVDFSSDEWTVLTSEEWSEIFVNPNYGYLPTTSLNRLPQAWIDIIVARTKPTSTKAWSEYNCKMANYESLFLFAQQGLLVKNDIPVNGPNIADYPDLVLKVDGGCLGVGFQWWLRQELPI